MEVKLKFHKRRSSLATDDIVTVNVCGPPSQVNDIIEAIRKRIKEEQSEKKELWFKVWEGFKEV